MKLYHGSNMDVKSPNLNLSKKYLDFGMGFYLTSDYDQAEQWARIKTIRAEIGVPTISVYEIDEVGFAELNVRYFNAPDRPWLDFVSDHRKGIAEPEDDDIIIGPVADDQTFQTIGLYLRGMITADMAIQLLLPHKLKDQYCFKTRKALSYQIFKEVVVL